MKKNFPVSIEFIYQIFALIVIVIIVHAAYVAVIRPKADAILARQATLIEEDKSQVTERSVYVLIRDYEQEACFVLMFWAMAIMAYKGVMTIRHRALLNQDLIPLAEGMRVLPAGHERADAHVRSADAPDIFRIHSSMEMRPKSLVYWRNSGKLPYEPGF